MSPWKLSLIKTTRIHRKILAPLEFNVKVDLTSYYRKSSTLQYLMYITMRYKSLNLRPIIHYIQILMNSRSYQLLKITSPIIKL